MSNYYRTFKVCVANSISYEAQYRYNTIIKLIANCLWVGMIFLTIEIIFNQTPNIAGWDKSAVYLMAIFWIMANELWVCLFGANLPLLPNAIVQGDLDIYLTKPLHPLFLVSLRIILTRGFYRFLMQTPVLVWVIAHFHISLTLGNSTLAIFLMFLSVWINYSISLLLNTLGFWFLKIDNINEAHAAVTILGRYPLSIWPKTVKILLLTIVPVAFSGFASGAAAVGNWPWYATIYAVLVAIVFQIAALGLWNKALKNYSSASS